MSTITIPKIEYDFLKKRAIAYERVLSVAQDEIFISPPTRNRKIIMRGLRSTRRYSKKFLRSVAKGLRRSAYFTE